MSLLLTTSEEDDASSSSPESCFRLGMVFVKNRYLAPREKKFAAVILSYLNKSSLVEITCAPRLFVTSNVGRLEKYSSKGSQRWVSFGRN